MARNERTTRKPTMIKAVSEVKTLGEKQLLTLCAKYWNELAEGYGIEYEKVHWDSDKGCCVESDGGHIYQTIDDFCNEASYWLSCYYEGGHCRHEEEYNDRKAFLKFLEVFKPFCKDKHTSWIPYKEETKFLFD